MKFGIYNSYWEHNWGGDCRPYILRVKKLGFDAFEVSMGGFENTAPSYWKELGKIAHDEGIYLTAGYGPYAGTSVSSADPGEAKQGQENFLRIFDLMALADIHFIGGGLYSYWPVDFSKPFDKSADRHRAVEGTGRFAQAAKERGIVLGMEVLNRFEGYLINTAEEAVKFVTEVGMDNVKIMLDTFHMNIEEDTMIGAILTAGSLLGHLHVGEANRKLPGQGRMPWAEIGSALRAIGYDGCIVMEPFVLEGGQIARDIKVWRDLSSGASMEELDQQAAESVCFLRNIFG